MFHGDGYEMKPNNLLEMDKMISELLRVQKGESKFVLPKGETLIYDKTWFEDPFWCRIIRQRPMGHLCGYVYVPEDHPYFGKQYSTGKDSDAPDVHGGITCCHPNDRHENPIIVLASNKQWWRLGFDCMHFNDDPPVKGATNYKDLKYVKSEVMKLRKQCEEAWTKS